MRKYRKIPIISPGLIFVQKAFLLGLVSEGLIIGGNFAFQNELCLTIKTALTNSPWAYVREGLSTERYLRQRLEGGGGYFREGLFFIFFFGGGGLGNSTLYVR